MVTMENAEEVMQILERFTRLKQKEIPKELDDYLQYVAKTGDTVFKWASLKYLFREKLLNVIKNFYDSSPRTDEIPQYPNVDPFNYESMKSSLLERLDLFNAAPFTIQRLCELLIDPRKQYSRIDKFMRALEKNILVVSTIEPGRKRTESENGDSLDSMVNGDLSLDVNVDIDMESESIFLEGQNGSATAEETAETSEATIKPVTASPKCAHRTDDENLPNPKKAKLDLPDSKEEQVDLHSSGNVQQVSPAKVETSDTESAKMDGSTADIKDTENETKVSEDKNSKSVEIVEAEPDKTDDLATDVKEMEIDAELIPKKEQQESESEKQKLVEKKVEQEEKEPIGESEKEDEKGRPESKAKAENDDKLKQDMEREKETEQKSEKCDEEDTKLEKESKKEQSGHFFEKQESEKCEKDEKVQEGKLNNDEKSEVKVKNLPETMTAPTEDDSTKEPEELNAKKSNDTKKEATDEADNIVNKELVVDNTHNVSNTNVVTASTTEEENVSIIMETDKNLSKNEPEVEAFEKPAEFTTTKTTTKSNSDNPNRNTELMEAKVIADSDAPCETTAITDEIISSTTTDTHGEPNTVTKDEDTAGSSNEVEIGTSIQPEEKKETSVVKLKESEDAAVENSIDNTKIEKFVADAVSESEPTNENVKGVDQLTTVENRASVETSVISTAQNELAKTAVLSEEAVTEGDEVVTVSAVSAEPAKPVGAVPPKEVKSVEDAVPDVDVISPSKIVADPISTTTPSTVTLDVPPVLVLPTLALNDQPMEDVATIDSTIVEEVVMAESTCAEMATDSMDAAKDEPSGMEVDDTSQEAMDQ